MPETNLLGNYLKDRRARLDPATFGIPATRRRTPGLRREEVAQRANLSATWYTWLEQGRGGAPSTDVLDRIAGALALSAVEREHLFLLAQNRMPEAHYESFEPITPQLQRVIDSLEFSPTVVKTALWDIVAWNHAASVIFTDYALLAPDQRNILRIMFCDPRVRKAMVNWEDDVRTAVASYRSDVARAGATERVKPFVDALSEENAHFKQMWSDYAVRNHGEGSKLVLHPTAGTIKFEFSSFAIDDRPDLSMVIYTPGTPDDRARVKSIISAHTLAP